MAKPINANDSKIIYTIAIGAAYGTSKAGIGIAGLGTFKPELIMKVSSSTLSSPTAVTQ